MEYCRPYASMLLLEEWGFIPFILFHQFYLNPQCKFQELKNGNGVICLLWGGVIITVFWKILFQNTGVIISV